MAGIGFALCALFAASNIGLTLVTQMLGPRFYGYGFAISVYFTSLVGLWVLTRKLNQFEYRLFMT